jgi:hypothetical protein
MSPPKSIRSKSRRTRSIALPLKWSTTSQPSGPPPGALLRMSDGRIQNPNSFQRPEGTDQLRAPPRTLSVRSIADSGSRTCGGPSPATRMAVAAISRRPAAPGGGRSGTGPLYVVPPCRSIAP